jgi:PAS domain S-box-containing protein
MDQKSQNELSLFFNNSIFGAFFMMIDKPVEWIPYEDNREAMEYILHNMRITRVNETFLSQYNTTEEDMLGKTPYDFFEHDIEQEIELLTNIFNKGKHLDISYEKKADGSDVVFEGDYVVLYENGTGRLKGVFGVQKDITERMKQENQLKKSLREKEVLLSEIHHRVKNNLAVISAMMQLQAFETENSELSAKLNESMLRIKTMAAIHELLYQNDSFSELHFSSIIRKLTALIQETFAPRKEIDYELRLQDVELSINQAIPGALIANEVLTNVFKHAFFKRESGRLFIELREENDTIKLLIRDDGAGFSVADYVNGPKETLGMQIIRILANQIGGDHNFESSPGGTEFSLVFKKSKLKGIGSAFI